MTAARTDCSLTFIGTATTLLRFGRFTILTDPNFLHRGQHAYLGYGLASRRRTDPAMTIDELPPLDAVVLSHMHSDHWDRVARRGLRRDLPIVTTPKAARAHCTGNDSQRPSRCGRGRARTSCARATGSRSPQFPAGTQWASPVAFCPRSWAAC